MASMTTDQVKAWQTTLKNAGYDPGEIDGVWGTNTQAAYNAYTAAKTAGSSAALGGAGSINYSDIASTADWSQPVTSSQPSAQTSSQYAGSGLPTIPTVDVSGAYQNARDQYQKYLNKAYESTQADTNAQAAKLKQQYDAARGQANINARLSAIGNNEALAANGLAGNMYASPTSGMSESSRIAQDVALRNNVNSQTLQENSARDELALQLIQAGYTRDINYAQYLAQSMIDEMNTNIDYSQQKFENQLSLYQLAQQAAASAAGTSTTTTGTGSGSSNKWTLSDADKEIKTVPTTAGDFTSQYNTAIYDIYQRRGESAAVAALNSYLSSGDLSSTGYQQGINYIKTLKSSSPAVLAY